MKHTCKCCSGSGLCAECAGNGEIEAVMDIESFEIPDNHEQTDALKSFKADARRVRRQCEELQKFNPTLTQRYAQQLNAVLTEINRQAEELLE